MKKNKIIGALVGVFGVAISIGTAIALYTKPVGNLELGIGSATHTSSTSTVKYKINGKTSDESSVVAPSYYKTGGVANGGSGFGGEYVCAKYEYILGADFASDIQEQDYVVGNLSVTLENVISTLHEKVKVSMYFEGYAGGSIGAVNYGSNLTSSSTAINETIITGSSLTVDSRDICVASSGVQKFIVFFELLNTVDFLSMNEASALWSLSVRWGAPVNFVPAYVANTKTLWEEDDEFVMAPNIDRQNADGWQWIAQIKGTDKVTEAKCRQGSNWQAGGNTTIALNTVYDVKWQGGNDGQYAAEFVAK